MAGVPAYSRKLALSNTCLAIYAGSETSHSIIVSSDTRRVDARNGLRANTVRWSEFGQSEEESEESDEMELGISPRPTGPSFPAPALTIHGEHGSRSANGLGRGRWDAGAGV